MSLADRIDALLPQTQCTRCGYAACRPYAEAIAAGEAAIDRCPPGGAAGIGRLARMLGRPVLALDPECGEEKPVETLAKIVEADCIGCTKCIQVCPVDAIVGAAQLMHTVIEQECTGCELCLPVCPVDCIAMFESAATPPPFERAEHFRDRFGRRQRRLAAWDEEDARRRRAHKAMLATAEDPVAAALARARRGRDREPA
jgi:electron transport complex protein RnfB